MAILGPILSTTEGIGMHPRQKNVYSVAKETFPRPGAAAKMVESACAEPCRVRSGKRQSRAASSPYLGCIERHKDREECQRHHEHPAPVWVPAVAGVHGVRCSEASNSCSSSRIGGGVPVVFLEEVPEKSAKANQLVERGPAVPRLRPASQSRARALFVESRSPLHTSCGARLARSPTVPGWPPQRFR